MSESLPLGFRFRPTDQEIIKLLLSKARGNGLDTFGGIIDYCDLYDDERIWMSKFLETNKEELYFFSKLRKKFCHGGSRIRRASLNGTWNESKSGEIKYGNKVIGKKHKFNFMSKGIRVEDRWLMTEFRIAPDLINRVKDESIVLCRITRRKALRPRVPEENRKDLRMAEFVPSPLKIQTRNNESVASSETTEQVETITGGTLSLQNNNYESFAPAMMLPENVTTEATSEQVATVTEGTFSSLEKNYYGSFAAAIMMPETVTTQTTQLEETGLIRNNWTNVDSSNEVWLEIEDLVPL